VFWFEAKKLHERLLDALTPNDMHAGFHQQFDGERTFPGQTFARKRKRTFVPIALPNDEMVTPILFFRFSRKPVLVRPRYRINAIFSDAHPAASEQRVQSAAA
jgi:hypothetical protein